MTVVGYQIKVGDKMYFVTSKPTHTVVKYITDEEFNKATQSAESKWVVRESLTLLSGGKIIINYIKKARL